MAKMVKGMVLLALLAQVATPLERFAFTSLPNFFLPKHPATSVRVGGLLSLRFRSCEMVPRENTWPNVQVATL